MIGGQNYRIYIIADFMHFVFNDTGCPMARFFENSDCRNHSRIDYYGWDIVLPELNYTGEEFLWQNKKETEILESKDQ